MKLEWQILTETENWVAINKPSGLLSVPDREGKETSLKRDFIIFSIVFVI